MVINFNPAKENDLETIREIYNYYVRVSTATFHTHDITPDEVRAMVPLNHSLYRTYMIYQDNIICGYCYLGQYKKREAYNRTAEVTIYLKPEFSGKGIGLKALDFLHHYAENEGIKVLMGIISGDNTGSMKLFEKAGYEKCGHFRQLGEKFGKILDVVAYQKIIG